MHSANIQELEERIYELKEEIDVDVSDLHLDVCTLIEEAYEELSSKFSDESVVDSLKEVGILGYLQHTLVHKGVQAFLSAWEELPEEYKSIIDSYYWYPLGYEILREQEELKKLEEQLRELQQA